MSKFFSLDELTKKDEEKEEVGGKAVEKFIDLHTEKVKNIRQLTGRLPTEGEAFFLWTVNSFNAFTFIPFIIRECGIINEIYIATYSINTRIIDALMRLINSGKILNVHLFISDSIKYRLPRVYDHLDALCSNRKEITVHYAWNHAKIALIKAGDNFFDVEGSGNFSENAQHEQYVFINSEKIYKFRKEEIINGFLSGTNS